MMKWKLDVGGSMILSGGVGGERLSFDRGSPPRLKRWMSHVGQRKVVVEVIQLLKSRLGQYA